MRGSTSLAARFSLLLALLFVGSSLWCQQKPEPSATTLSYKERITKLEQNLTQALQLCGALKTNLDLQLANYQSLKTSYDSLVQTQKDSEEQIASLEASLQSSEESLKASRQDLLTIKQLSDSLQSSLATVSKSLEDYKRKAEATIKDLELRVNGWKVVGIVGVGVAVTEGGYLIGGTKGAAVAGVSYALVWAGGHFLFHIW